MGVTIFAVGVQGIYLPDLNALASAPTAKVVYLS
jgi:hypothetical protein